MSDIAWPVRFLVGYVKTHIFNGDDMIRILDEAAAGDAAAQMIDEAMTTASISWRQARQGMTPEGRARFRNLAAGWEEQ